MADIISTDATPTAEPSGQPVADAFAPAEGTPAPQTFDVGGEQVPLEELQKGYLRQQDYTRKTQSLADQRREIEQLEEFAQALQSRPDIVQAIDEMWAKQPTGLAPPVAEAQPQGIPPAATLSVQQQMQQMREEIKFELEADRQMQGFSMKHPDVDLDKVLDFAVERNIPDLNDAYELMQYRESNRMAQQQEANKKSQVETQGGSQAPVSNNPNITSMSGAWDFIRDNT